MNPYDYERMRFLLEAMLATDEVSRVADDKTRTVSFGVTAENLSSRM